MKWEPKYKPKLRSVQVFRLDGAEAGMFGLRDRCGLSPVKLTVSEGALMLMSLMDGEHDCETIREKFQAGCGAPVSPETLAKVLDNLDQAFFLEGPKAEEFYKSLQAEYLSHPTRRMSGAGGPDRPEKWGELFREILEQADRKVLPGKVVGLIAPHLDYQRGAPCYGLAYATLRDRSIPDRVIVLGVNHFGRSTSVVATGKDFETPLGTTLCDVAFLERLEDRCGSLRAGEVDHGAEHSIELQVAWLQHLFGADTFKMVPFLCPDPCGPTGTAPYDGKGVDLRAFALNLSAVMAEDGSDTLIVAGADWSHVGAEFGDERPLDDSFLREVGQRDRRALDAIEANMPDRFVNCVAGDDNPTRVCSAGCIFALATALPEATATVLGYHQAVTPQARICVTCAAVAYT